MKLDNDIIFSSINDITNNSIKNAKIISKNEKKEKNKLNANIKNIRQNKIISYKTLKNKIKTKSYNLEQLNKFNLKIEEVKDTNKIDNYIENNAEQQSKKIKEKNDINYLFFEEYENVDAYEKNYFIEKDNEHVEKKQNSSFEIISLSENNLNENDNSQKEEDNFDDINSIIKKINFNSKENIDNDIFSLNNQKYRNYDKIFDKRFNEMFLK